MFFTDQRKAKLLRMHKIALSTLLMGKITKYRREVNSISRQKKKKNSQACYLSVTQADVLRLNVATFPILCYKKYDAYSPASRDS